MLITTEVSIDVASEELARAAILTGVASFKGSIAKNDVAGIDVKRGSQVALRLKGGLIAPLVDFPVRACISFVPKIGGGATVWIRVEDTLTVGLKVGMTNKYQSACTELAQLIVGLVQGK
jgi:hypothetical protein